MLNEFENHVAEFANSKLSKEQLIANFAMGLAGESGELVDLLKKHLFHDQPLDRAKTVSEIGDVFWYAVALCQQLQISPSEAMQVNIEKLRRRHEGRSFNPQAAIKNKETE